MSIVNVAEYANLSTNANGGIQIPLGTPTVSYDVAVSAGSTAGVALQSTTRMVRINCDVSCRVRLDTGGVCTASDARFAANQTEYWGVPGPGFKISTIQSS